MPLSAFPLPGADLLNAGNALRDRGRYLKAGTFTWLGSGTTGFQGMVLGYAPNAQGGSYQIDGGAAHSVHGQNAVEVNRWAGGSVTVNGGIAWGVAYPAGSNLPSFKEVTDAVDRTHKDGTLSTVQYNFDLASNGGGAPVANGNLTSQSGSGIILSCSVMSRAGPPGFSGSYARSAYYLDFTIDGAFRFSVGFEGAIGPPAFGAVSQAAGSFGMIRYASSFVVAMRYACPQPSHVDAAVTFVSGA